MRGFPLWASSLIVAVNATASATELSGPFLESLGSGTGWIIGNDLWNITIGETYGTKLFFQGQDLIGNAVGHYSGYGELKWSST